MDIQNFIIDNYFFPRIREKGCLVIYDTWKFKDVLNKITNKKIKIIDTSQSDLGSRKSSFENILKLSKKNSNFEGFIIYIPYQRPVDREKILNPFSIYELIGDYFPKNDADQYINICKSFKPDEISKIDEIFNNHTNLPNFEIINKIGNNDVWPILSHNLRADSNLEIIKGILNPNNNQIKYLESNSEWLNECKTFLKQVLDFNISNFKNIQELADQIWQFLLFSEFVFDLPKNSPEFPKELNNVQKANQNKLHFIEKICESLRNDLKIQDLYIEKSNQIENKLKLENFFMEFDDLGIKDTFAFEDKTYLNKSINFLKESKFSDVQKILNNRQSSIWFKLGDQTPLEWNLIKICLNLLQKIYDLDKIFSGKTSNLTKIIDFYKTELYSLDTLIRNFISTKNELISEKFVELIKIVEEQYSFFSDKLQNRFITNVKIEGWPPQDFKSNFSIFNEYASPLILNKKSRIIYFMIDALRYELGVELKNFLENENLQLQMDTSFSSLPSVTNIGMASLLPDAESEINFNFEDNHLNVLYSNKKINDVSKRMDVFRNRFGDQFKEINLDNITSNLKKDIQKNIKLLVVRSFTMDKLLETNELNAVNTLFDTFKKIKLSINILSELGFTDAIIVSDHGFLLNLYNQDRGSVINKPEGNWYSIHDRCLLGNGDEDDNNLAFSCKEIGLKGLDNKILFPKSIYPYKKNKFYLHGGLSIQETLVPVITAKLNEKKGSKEKDFNVKLSYKDALTDIITTRNPIINLEVSSLDLVSQAEEEEVEIIIKVFDKKNNIIGDVKSNIDIPDYKLLKVIYGEKRKITIKLNDKYEGDVIIKAIDPYSDIVLDELKLKTDYLL